jgi:hypothetical protein
MKLRKSISIDKSSNKQGGSLLMNKATPIAAGNLTVDSLKTNQLVMIDDLSFFRDKDLDVNKIKL